MDLIVATEIGSVRFIAEFLKKDDVYFLAGSDVVEEYVINKTSYKPYSNQEIFPQNIYLGSTIGPSLERKVFLKYKNTDAKIISFIDSPWNISQRFADERTGEKWIFSPKEIVVPHLFIKKDLLNLGYDGNIIVHKRNLFEVHFSQGIKSISLQEIKKTRATYGIEEDETVFIFISEYEQKIPKNWKIQPDQFSYHEIQKSLDSFITFYSNYTKPKKAFIKWHPTKLDKHILAIDPNLKFDELNEIEKKELFCLGDFYIGLNSMLLLEAYNFGLNTMSFQTKEMINKRSLCDIVGIKRIVV